MFCRFPVRRVLFKTQAGSTGKKLREIFSYIKHNENKCCLRRMSMHDVASVLFLCLPLCPVFYFHGWGLILKLCIRSVGRHSVSMHYVYRWHVHYGVFLYIILLISKYLPPLIVMKDLRTRCVPLQREVRIYKPKYKQGQS